MRKERAQFGERLQRHIRKVVFADDVGALLAAQVAARRGFNQYMRWKWRVLAHDYLCAICVQEHFSSQIYRSSYDLTFFPDVKTSVCIPLPRRGKHAP